jgi:hypothetical protein
MKWKVKEPVSFIRTVRENFFLRKHEISPSTLHVLQSLYPSVDWDRVDFYEGLPWFTPTVAPYVNAQALPQFYSFNKFRIYLRKFDESRAQCVADIVHEAFHINQAMHFKKGYGIGFFRIWMFYYIAHFLREGYRNNVFEIPAYNQEFRFLDACNRHNVKGVLPAVNADDLRKVISEPGLVFPGYEYKYSGNWFFLPLSFIICLAVLIVKPLADALVYIISWPSSRKKERHQAAAIRSS